MELLIIVGGATPLQLLHQDRHLTFRGQKLRTLRMEFACDASGVVCLSRDDDATEGTWSRRGRGYSPYYDDETTRQWRVATTGINLIKDVRRPFHSMRPLDEVETRKPQTQRQK